MSYTYPPLEALLVASLKAGAEILKYYGAGYKAEEKSDGSPVTLADTSAEKAIVEELAVRTPHIPVVGEEGVSQGIIPESCDLFYLVDPLDGTKEFISGSHEFTVNIALIENGRPVMGVVYAPALEVLFAAEPGKAFEARVRAGRIENEARLRTRNPVAPLTGVGSKSHGNAATESLAREFAVEQYLQRGSSLKFCTVARGEADIYPRLGRTMEWDTAAGHAILNEAGGCVVTLDGLPLKYNKRKQKTDADFANGHFVAFGRPEMLFQLDGYEHERT